MLIFERKEGKKGRKREDKEEVKERRDIWRFLIWLFNKVRAKKQKL